MNPVISNRYAKALFLLAKKENLLQEISRESQSVIDFFSNQKGAMMLLKNPVVSKEKKTNIFQKSFQGQLSTLMQSFIKLVIDKGRYRDLLSILDQYIEIYRKEMNIISLELVTTKKINDSLKQKINNKLGAQENVLFKETIDPKILGGILIRLNDLQFDATVKNKLNNVRKTFKI
jgi:F-type H+-transporting ATPase subunit delta